MFKLGDDLRQDQLILQLITLMDRILRRENLDLKLSPYNVLACSSNHGTRLGPRGGREGRVEGGKGGGREGRREGGVEGGRGGGRTLTSKCRRTMCSPVRAITVRDWAQEEEGGMEGGREGREEGGREEWKEGGEPRPQTVAVQCARLFEQSRYETGSKRRREGWREGGREGRREGGVEGGRGGGRTSTSNCRRTMCSPVRAITV